MPHAVARLNWGRWIADCPNPSCLNAQQLTPGQQTLVCRFQVGPMRWDGCGTTAAVAWPDNPAGVVAKVVALPESEQNWTPDGGYQ